MAAHRLALVGELVFPGGGHGELLPAATAGVAAVVLPRQGIRPVFLGPHTGGYVPEEGASGDSEGDTISEFVPELRRTADAA